MNEMQQQIDPISEALAEVPEQYRAQVIRNVIHDIGVMKQAIQLVQLTQQAG